MCHRVRHVKWDELARLFALVSCRRLRNVSASFEWAKLMLQYFTAEWEPAFLRQAREFPFFPLLPREASKSVPIFDRGTGSKPERLRSGFLQADLSLIV